MADPTDESLRMAARHRGLKLVKSRRRKPGGDYGRYGLTDPAGAQLFGFGAQGLEADAGQIESYLRAGEVDTWRKSAATPVAVPKRKRTPAATVDEDNRPAAAKPAAKPEAKPAAEQPEPALPEPEPDLALRPARKSDAAAIADLLRTADNPVSASAVAGRLSSRGAAGAIVGERREVVGCVTWALFETVHRGTIGRITAIAVLEERRRQGIGRALIEQAIALLAEKGCAEIEAMSAIEIANAHGFFRAAGFSQTSYRFARAP